MQIFSKILFKVKEEGALKTLYLICKFICNINKHLSYKKVLNIRNKKKLFSEIYKKNMWNSKETRSGEGSEFKYTANLRIFLPKIISHFKIKVIIDAPCGDFNWMKHIIKNKNLKYIGLDIVPKIINANKKNYSQNNITFITSDICKDKIPNCDLLIVRDCLFHFSYKDISKFLLNISRADYKYLLTTTHVVKKNFKNRDIATGDFRLINLFKYPFNFKKRFVISEIKDYPKDHKTPRKLILVKKKNVPIY